MKAQIKIIFYSSIFFAIGFFSCTKFLDKKENPAKAIPESLSDIQALLDNYVVFNFRYSGTGMPALIADEHYELYSNWAPGSTTDFGLNYIWDKNATSKDEYAGLYQPVFYANNALDLLSKIKTPDSESSEYKSMKGQALFYRAFAFYHLAQLYCKPFTNTASTDPGISLRLDPGIEEKSVRSTVQETYDRIITDLKEAADLLPTTPYAISYYISRPAKAAAYGALARTYLSMRDYVNARIYADACLNIYSTLVDYNILNPNSSIPFTKTNNAEILFMALLPFSVNNNVFLTDTLLYQSYATNDLRKNVYFKPVTNGYIFKGEYLGEYGSLCGLATDEMYLIRAECAARAGDVSAAITDLNALMIKRWKNDGSFIPYSAVDAVDALNKVLTERRKELVYRGTRWMDLRRLNLEGFNITLKRVLNGTTYTLPPGDLRWVLLLPIDVVNLSGMPQNPR